MINKRTIALPLACLIFLAGSVGADDYPQGCVDCHAQRAGAADFRLNVLLQEIGHRWVRTLRVVPRDCGKCHTPDEEPTFSSLVHVIHYDVPTTNLFVTRDGGDCQHCHTMDAEEGEVAVKSGPRNW